MVAMKSRDTRNSRAPGRGMVIIGGIFSLMLFNSLMMMNSSPNCLTVGGELETRKGLAEGPIQTCHQNPYLQAIQEPSWVLQARADLWLYDLPKHHQKGLNTSAYDPDGHGRFFPFEEMATCTEKTCIGGACFEDESKTVCGLSQVVPTTQGTKSKCIAYSIGGNNQWSYEKDLLAKTHCEIHTFDCTGPRDRFRVPENDGRLHFHHVCLGTKHEDAPETCGDRRVTKCGETWTLLEIQQKLNHSQVDLFKMDIEGWEWPEFESWPLLKDASADQILLPNQIMVEIHFQTQFKALWDTVPKEQSRKWGFKTPSDLIRLQQRFLEMGYIIVERDDNKDCPVCTELVYVRAQCPQTGVYSEQHRLAQP